MGVTFIKSGAKITVENGNYVNLFLLGVFFDSVLDTKSLGNQFYRIAQLIAVGSLVGKKLEREIKEKFTIPCLSLIG